MTFAAYQAYNPVVPKKKKDVKVSDVSDRKVVNFIRKAKKHEKEHQGWNWREVCIFVAAQQLKDFNGFKKHREELWHEDKQKHVEEHYDKVEEFIKSEPEFESVLKSIIALEEKLYNVS
jgi:hypothetical protein